MARDSLSDFDSRVIIHMKLVLRWFPYGDDSVSLKHIKQVPGVSGVATHLTRIPVGDIWTMDEINLVKNEINSYGLEMEVIESLNIHEDIKKGLPTRTTTSCLSWTGTGAILQKSSPTAVPLWLTAMMKLPSSPLKLSPLP